MQHPPWLAKSGAIFLDSGTVSNSSGYIVNDHIFVSPAVYCSDGLSFLHSDRSVCADHLGRTLLEFPPHPLRACAQRPGAAIHFAPCKLGRKCVLPKSRSKSLPTWQSGRQRTLLGANGHVQMQLRPRATPTAAMIEFMCMKPRRGKA